MEATVAHSLVDLALVAPENTFLDIIRTFSNINRAANSEDSQLLSDVVIRHCSPLSCFFAYLKKPGGSAQVLTAQTRLARELRCRPDLRDVYLQELLVLFADNGTSIQTVATSHQHRKVNHTRHDLH